MSSTSISDYISKCTPSKRIEDHHPSTSSLDCHLSDHFVKLLHNATGGFWFDVEQLGNIKIHKIEVERKIAVLNLLKEILHHPSFCPTFIILTMDQLLQLQLATKQTESRSRDFIFNFFKFCRNNWRSFRKAASTRCFWNSSPGSRIPINPRPILPRRAHTMVTLTCQGWLVIGMVHPLIVFADNAVVLPLTLCEESKTNDVYRFTCPSKPKMSKSSNFGGGTMALGTSPSKGSSWTFSESSKRMGRKATKVKTDWSNVAPMSSTILAKSFVSSCTLWLAPSITRSWDQCFI